MRRMIKKDEQTNEGRAPCRPSLAALPAHVATVRLPNGRTLGELSAPEIARLCGMARIPNAGPEFGRQHNAEALTARLEMVGRQAAETAISTWLQTVLGDGS